MIREPIDRTRDDDAPAACLGFSRATTAKTIPLDGGIVFDLDGIDVLATDAAAMLDLASLAATDDLDPRPLFATAPRPLTRRPPPSQQST